MNLSELRLVVIYRDRQCVASLLDRSHQCRDRWGVPQESSDLVKLTLEHVRFEGKRIDEPLHCVAMCSEGNVAEHWSSANNGLANAYLAGVRVGQASPSSDSTDRQASEV